MAVRPNSTLTERDNEEDEVRRGDLAGSDQTYPETPKVASGPSVLAARSFTFQPMLVLLPHVPQRAPGTSPANATSNGCVIRVARRSCCLRTRRSGHRSRSPRPARPGVRRSDAPTTRLARSSVCPTATRVVEARLGAALSASSGSDSSDHRPRLGHLVLVPWKAHEPWVRAGWQRRLGTIDPGPETPSMLAM